MWWVFALGCDRVLEEGFEDEVVKGWSCEGLASTFPTGPPPISWYGLDEGESFRIQVWLPAREATFPDDEASFFVYSGASLLLADRDERRCDDVSQSGFFDRQRIDHRYRATAGSAEAIDAGGAWGLLVAGIVLEAPGVPAVELADGELPAFAADGPLDTR